MKIFRQQSEMIRFVLFFSFNFYLFVFGCIRAFSSCGEQGLLFIVVPGLTAVALLVAEDRLYACGLRELQHMGSVVAAYRLSCSAAYGIFQTRNQTCVLCPGKQILNHWSTRGSPESVFLKYHYSCVGNGLQVRNRAEGEGRSLEEARAEMILARVAT